MHVLLAGSHIVPNSSLLLQMTEWRSCGTKDVRITMKASFHLNGCKQTVIKNRERLLMKAFLFLPLQLV